MVDRSGFWSRLRQSFNMHLLCKAPAAVLGEASAKLWHNPGNELFPHLHDFPYYSFFYMHNAIVLHYYFCALYGAEVY